MAGRKGPGASHDEVALFRCTCVNAPTDRTTEPQPPHRHEHAAHFSQTSATASPGLAAVAEQPCRLGLVASTCHTSQSTLAAGAKQRVPVRDAEGRVLLEYVFSPGQVPSAATWLPTPTPIACELASCELYSVGPCACWVAMTEDRTHLAQPSRET